MERPEDKAALLDALHGQKAYWEALLAVVRPEDMLLPGVTGDWTFKDVVAHLTGWRKRTVARFAGARQGGTPLPPEWPAELGDDVQQANAWIYRTNSERPLPDILAESRQVWQQLVDLVAAMPEDDLFEPGRFEWLGDNWALGPTVLNWSFGHLHEHAAQINDWLAGLLEDS